MLKEISLNSPFDWNHTTVILLVFSALYNVTDLLVFLLFLRQSQPRIINLINSQTDFYFSTLDGNYAHQQKFYAYTFSDAHILFSVV